jgi:hypothetical protein
MLLSSEGMSSSLGRKELVRGREVEKVIKEVI